MTFDPDVFAQYLTTGLDAAARMLTDDDRVIGATSFSRYARERLWIRPKVGGQIPFRLTPIQKRYAAIKRHARMQGKIPHYLTLKYRRGGITTFEQGQSYQLTSQQPNTSAVTVAHSTADTSKIFRIARLFHRRDIHAPPLKGTGNAQRLEFPTLNSIFEIGTVGSSGPGRGDTLQRFHGSEVSSWNRGPRQIELQEDALAGYMEAASHGEVVLETTAKGNDKFCQLYREAKQGLNDWTPIFLPWFADRENRDKATNEEVAEIVGTLSEREKALIQQHRLDPYQIKWRRRKVRSLGRLFPQEYPEDDATCFLMSGTRFFPPDIVIDLLEDLEEWGTVNHLPGGHERIWYPPEKDKKYVIGSDTSEGIVGGDPNGVGVMDMDGRMCASVHGLFRPDTHARHIHRLHGLYNGAYIGVERENHGGTVCDCLSKMPIPRSRIYHFKKGRMGWSTNAQTRPIMLDDLAEAVTNGFIEMNDRDFLKEMTTFGLQANNKWEHDSGAHDDSLFKWGIAWQMRKFRTSRGGVSHIHFTS
jgi:hypothetical protein